jgi:hypothetical protein
MNKLTKEEAQEAGINLVNRLIEKTGLAWQVVINQNLGWHYSARFKWFSVYPNGDTFFTLISEDCDKYPGTGAGFLSGTKSTADTPEGSLRLAAMNFTFFMDDLADVYDVCVDIGFQGKLDMSNSEESK